MPARKTLGDGDLSMHLPTRLLLAAGCVGLLALGNSAFSAPASRAVAHQHRAQHVIKTKPIAQHATHGIRNVRHMTIAQRAAKLAARHRAPPRVAHAGGTVRLTSRPVVAEPKRPVFGWPLLVREARKYIGTNPTARTKLWCATFMNLVLAKVGYTGTNSDAARSFATYGHRISEPRVGAIAVLARGKTGGHVGVVSGIDPHGNPIIISGNHGHRVGEGIYSRSRVIAYVMPSERRPTSETRIAKRSIEHSTPATTDTLSAASRVPSETVIDSPIAELVAAIEAEKASGKAKTRPAPHHSVQQMPARPQHVAQRPAEHLARHPAPPRHHMRPHDLPLDPALARLLGIKTRAQAPHHRLHANHVASAR
jgi:uncharacterized protein (TIGR02594 family)